MSLSRYEQETFINYNDEEGTAKVYTASPIEMRRLDKMVASNGAEWKIIKSECLDGKIISKTYECPKDFVRHFRTKEYHRSYTEEQRKQFSDRMKALTEEQKKQREAEQ